MFVMIFSFVKLNIILRLCFVESRGLFGSMNRKKQPLHYALFLYTVCNERALLRKLWSVTLCIYSDYSCISKTLGTLNFAVDKSIKEVEHLHQTQ
jgi:hypothetical protein